MSYGTLTPEQEAALRPYVAGRVVHDLGAGDLTYARRLLDLGAQEVVAIDKERSFVSSVPGITYRQAYFHEVEPGLGTVFLSWPVNWNDRALLLHALSAHTLVYLGKNTDGTACGTPALFEAMVHRALLAYVPDPRNCLVITGPIQAHARTPTPEERAGMTSMHRMWSYLESERSRD